jgi:hypothetical protein
MWQLFAAKHASLAKLLLGNNSRYYPYAPSCKPLRLQSQLKESTAVSSLQLLAPL